LEPGVISATIDRERRNAPKKDGKITVCENLKEFKKNVWGKDHTGAKKAGYFF
jgi:hypothetical protein